MKYQSLADAMEYVQGARQCLQHFVATGNQPEVLRERVNLRNGETRLAETMARLEAELAAEGIAPRPVVHVYYERGYKWSVDVDGGESIECNINKAEAVAIAKRVAASIGAVLDIQTMTRDEQKAAMTDRWDHARAVGQTALKFR